MTPADPYPLASPPAEDGRVVVTVAAAALEGPEARWSAAAVAGVPRAVVDALVTRGLPVVLAGPLPPASARARLPAIAAVVPAARVGVPGIPSPLVPFLLLGSGIVLLVAAGAVALYAEPVVGAAVATAGLADLGFAAWLGARVRTGASDAACALAQRETQGALVGDAASWMAVGGLRRAVLDLPESIRADVHAALDVLEARLAREEDARRAVAEIHDALDALRAGAVLGQRAERDAAALARRVTAVRAAAEATA